MATDKITVKDPRLPGRLYMVLYDDQQGLCVPTEWDVDCAGAICGRSGTSDLLALFTSRRAARTAIGISTKWNALLKAQGKPRNEDFEQPARNHLRVVPCALQSLRTP